jgi:hypothetical protein
MTPIKLGAVVGPGGKVELTLPLPAGTAVEVLIRDAESDDFRDLMEAAQSSLGFWDNPIDDEEWNAAPPG